MANKTLVRRLTTTAMALAIAVAAPLAAATPASAASWKVYGNYRGYYVCDGTGMALVDTGYAQRYDCRWDSPYWALWIYR